VKQALDNRRRELNLDGEDINACLAELNEENTCGLFSLTELNYLQITHTDLALVPRKINALSKLSSFVCHTNKLEKLPVSLFDLSQLTLLDLSRNKLTEIPEEIKNLDKLQTLNVSFNQLVCLPPLSGCKSLLIIDASHNDLETFVTTSEDLKLLSSLDLSYNKLKVIPPEIELYPSLKNLNLTSNSIKEAVGNLVNCKKT